MNMKIFIVSWEFETMSIVKLFMIFRKKCFRWFYSSLTLWINNILIFCLKIENNNKYLFEHLSSASIVNLMVDLLEDQIFAGYNH